ncbi:MAG TPA: Hsp33 family molecular chaperone HslO [Clostridiaceae bacterium]|jgi:molecular chaperone Hsp33|nr:Hsp33 family molecular chaperone HslO [Clostridiaceae bacterium]
MEGRIIKFLAYEGRALVKCIDSTNIVEEARKIHDLSPTVTAALGRLLTMTSMMGADLKEIEDSITVQIKGDGLAGTLTAVTDSNGNVKGYVTNPLVELPLNEVGKLDVSKAVGKNGMMYIIKDIGLKDPYVGMTPIISGEIAEDFTNYFAKSEQTPTVVALGVLVDKNGVKKAGGYQISLMPDAKEEDIENIEAAIKKADTISKMLNDEISLEQIAKIVTGDNDIKIIDDTIKPEYKCDCSREKIEKGLIAIGEKELQDIINTDGKAETVCQFCNKKYHFNKEELEKLINKK